MTTAETIDRLKEIARELQTLAIGLREDGFGDYLDIAALTYDGGQYMSITSDPDVKGHISIHSRDMGEKWEDNYGREV